MRQAGKRITGWGIGRSSRLAKALVWSCLFSALAMAAAAADDGLSPLTVPGAETVTTEQAHALFQGGVTFVDVRNPRLFARRHIPGAHHLDLSSDFNKAGLEALVDKDQAVVIYCSGRKCSRSSNATGFAVDWGFTEVKYYRDGIVGWRDAGLPLNEQR
jgi:rhodanese-related sulfurtransferase